MPIVRVQSAFNSGSDGNPTVTLPGPTSAGNFLYFIVANVGSSIFTGSPVYTGGQLPETGNVYINGGAFSCRQYYFYNISAATPATVSGLVLGPEWIAGLVEYSGIRTFIPVWDRNSSSLFIGTSPRNSGFTPVTIQAEEVAIGSSVLLSAVDTAVPTAPYTAIGTRTNVAGGFTLTLADLLLAATGSQNYHITYTSSLVGGVDVTTWRGSGASGALDDFSTLLGVS